VFHACFEVDSVALSTIFGDVGVDEVDDIGSDACAEDSRENSCGSGRFYDWFAFGFEGVVDMNDLSVNHGENNRN